MTEQGVMYVVVLCSKIWFRIVLTRERELTFDGFVEALIRLSVPVQARSPSSRAETVSTFSSKNDAQTR